MRFLRVRFTVRRMMVLIALVALLIAGEGMRRRVADYKRRADSHAWLEWTFGKTEQDAVSGANDIRRDAGELDRRLREAIRPHSETEAQLAPLYREAFAHLARNPSRSDQLADEMMKLARDSHLWVVWHGRMKERYRRTARRPWEALGPAPEPPKPLPESYDPMNEIR